MTTAEIVEFATQCFTITVCLGVAGVVAHHMFYDVQRKREEVPDLLPLYKKLLHFYTALPTDRRFGLCLCINMLEGGTLTSAETHYLRLDLFLNRPPNADPENYWWPLKDRGSRIEFLEKRIEELKAKKNGRV